MSFVCSAIALASCNISDSFFPSGFYSYGLNIAVRARQKLQNYTNWTKKNRKRERVTTEWCPYVKRFLHYNTDYGKETSIVGLLAKLFAKELLDSQTWIQTGTGMCVTGVVAISWLIQLSSEWPLCSQLVGVGPWRAGPGVRGESGLGTSGFGVYSLQMMRSCSLQKSVTFISDEGV